MIKQCVVAAMQAYPTNVELQQFAVEILSNLSNHTSRETSQQLTRGGTIDVVMKTAAMYHQHERIQVHVYVYLHISAPIYIEIDMRTCKQSCWSMVAGEQSEPADVSAFVVALRCDVDCLLQVLAKPIHSPARQGHANCQLCLCAQGAGGGEQREVSALCARSWCQALVCVGV